MHIAYRDTLQLAQKQPEPYFAHCSHRLMGGVGIGYGEVKGHGTIASQGDLSYAFFWSEHWGVSLGLGLDYYRSVHTSYSDKYAIDGYVDTDKEPQTTMLVSENNMNLQHTMLVVDMPLMLQMEYLISKRKKAYPVYLYGSLGARLGYPVAHRLNRSGDVTYSGYYKKWQLTIEDIHEYGTESIHERATFPVKTPTISPQAELGVALPVASDVAIGLGLYGNVSTWNESGYLPWQAGFKLSIRWRHPAKTKPKPAVYKKAVVRDTTWVVTEVTDTIYTAPIDTIIPEVKTPEKDTSFIWFDKDAVQPQMTSTDMLDHLATVLQAHPSERVVISGHACNLGSYEYNEQLSRRRAQAIADQLLQRGVADEQIEIKAYSYTVPYQTSSHDRSLDRRVEIVLIRNEQPKASSHEQ